jgi:hypothetical protein
MGRPGREFGHIGQTSQTLYLGQLDYEGAFLFPKLGQISFSKKDYVAQKLFPKPGLYHIKPYLSNLCIWCYNNHMSPRHFAAYAKRDPKGYAAFSDSLWNSFVSITHTVGLSRFFSFTPDFSAKKVYGAADGRFPDPQDQNKITKA